MYTDLFLALRDKENPRGHPILTALLYAYCPAAARWWLNGAIPALPFDPLWYALSERATGKTLAEVLHGMGFETLLEEVRRYLAQVETYRRHHDHVVAPELLPTFNRGQVEITKRFNLQAAIEHLGGDWRHFFPFVRAWAFVYRDWVLALKLSEAVFSPVRLALTLSGIPKAVYLPAWLWTAKNQESGSSKLLIGMVGWEADGFDQLRLSLAMLAGLAGEKAWPTFPEVRVLHPNGTTSPADLRVTAAELPALVTLLAQAAEDGPSPPLPALRLSPQCMMCGFHGQCFTPAGELTPLALSF